MENTPDPPTMMNFLSILAKPPGEELAPAEDAFLTEALSRAYRLDEIAATDPTVQRTAEAVRSLLKSGPPSPAEDGDADADAAAAERRSGSARGHSAP